MCVVMKHVGMLWNVESAITAQLSLTHTHTHPLFVFVLVGGSGGTKRKLSVACALLCDPTVVFLDEPSRCGVDVSVCLLGSKAID